jgi:flagellar biosynthesis/type III secretory pathway protein FliH
MDVKWDKEMIKKLVDSGLSWEQASLAVGIIAEERQTAYLQGYARGHNDGFADAKQKFLVDSNGY